MNQIGSKPISVRINVGVLEELNKAASKSPVSKNMIINRAVRHYSRLLEIMKKKGTHVDAVICSPELRSLLMEAYAKRAVYWDL